MNDNPADFNNDCIEHCSECNSRQMGTEHYANDAMGMATPVLWTCHRCDNPPILVGLWRKIKIQSKLKYGRAKYYLTTTKAERQAKDDAWKRKIDGINERRLSRGEKPMQYPKRLRTV